MREITFSIRHYLWNICFQNQKFLKKSAEIIINKDKGMTTGFKIDFTKKVSSTSHAVEWNVRKELTSKHERIRWLPLPHKRNSEQITSSSLTTDFMSPTPYVSLFRPSYLQVNVTRIRQTLDMKKEMKKKKKKTNIRTFSSFLLETCHEQPLYDMVNKSVFSFHSPV